LTRPVLVIRCMTPVYLFGVVRHTALGFDGTIDRFTKNRATAWTDSCRI
jgi:hypothetical protein